MNEKPLNVGALKKSGHIHSDGFIQYPTEFGSDKEFGRNIPVKRDGK